MHNFHKIGLLVAAMGLFGGVQATASTSVTGTIGVQLSVNATCTVGTSTGITFSGAYTGVTAVNGSGSISVTCTKDTAYSVTLDAGSNADGTQRRMGDMDKSDFLTYNLYSDSNRSSAWAPTTAVNGTGSGTAQSIPVYATVPGSQTPPVSAYSDTINITVSY